MAKFTQNDAWADTLRLMRTHWGALVAIAGVFNFLPVLLANYFLPWPDPSPDMEPARALAIYGSFLRHNLIWFVLESFVIMIGSAAVLRLVFRRTVTLGGARLHPGQRLGIGDEPRRHPPFDRIRVHRRPCRARGRPAQAPACWRAGRGAMAARERGAGTWRNLPRMTHGRTRCG